MRSVQLSRTEPSNQGCVKCRFGRILTYQDALDQFEVVVTLPIALIGVTPQDLLELTDITSLRQQVSPMSTPDRKKALKLSDTFGYKSPHRLASPTSTPDRQKGISMDLRDRLNPSARGGPLNESSFAGKANLDMRSRLAATASDNLDDKVSPNRSVHTVSAKSRMEASPVSNIPPKTKSDLVEGITELPVKPPAQMEVPSKARADLAAAAAAIKSSKSAEDGVKIANPFFIPSPSRDAAERAAAAPKRSSPSRSAASITAAENKAARAHATAETVKVADASSSFGNLKFILIGTMVFILFFLAKFLFGGGNSVIKPAFTEKPVGIYRTERIFADAVKNYKGILRPDIVIVD